MAVNRDPILISSDRSQPPGYFQGVEENFSEKYEKNERLRLAAP